MGGLLAALRAALQAALERWLDRLALALALGGAVCLLGVALLTMADVLLRWGFNAPIRGVNDVSALLTAVVVAACFPILMMRRGNVTIRLLGEALGPRTARLFDVFGALVSSAFFGLMTWQYIRFSAEMASANESSPILRWPSAPWWWAVTALIAVATLAALWRCLVVTSQEK